MLFQESALFDSLTIEENVAYPLLNQKSIHCPPDQVHPRVVEALDFVELGDTLEKFPSELSGGMRRRAAIARAVVTEPPLMLYDSPTAGLDPITAHTIIALLIKERDISQTTTLMVTHRYQDGNLMANFRYNSKQGRSGAGAQRGAAATAYHFHGAAGRPAGLRRRSGPPGSVHGSLHLEVREAAGIDDAGSQQSTVVAVEGRSGGAGGLHDPVRV